MTKLEKLELLGMTELLADGEIYEDGKIIKVEAPESLMRPGWDREKGYWKETMTKEEVMTQRKDKILKYAALKKEIETLEELNDLFASDDTIEMLKEEMEALKVEINDLYSKGKELM